MPLPFLSLVAEVFKYLFVFSRAGSSLLGRLSLAAAGGCGGWAPRSGGFSRGAQALGAPARWSQLAGLSSLVSARWLSCRVAWGIFLEQGSDSCPLQWQADSSPLDHQGSPCGGRIYQKLKLLGCLRPCLLATRQKAEREREDGLDIH